MGNTDSKKRSPRKSPTSQTTSKPEMGEEPKAGYNWEVVKLKAKAFEFIRKRINDKGLKEFYADEIIAAVIPDATFTFITVNECVLTCKTFKFSAQNTNKLIAKRKVAAEALKLIFGISLPVYETPTNAELISKYHSYVKYEIVSLAPWKAIFKYDNTVFEAFGPTQRQAQEKLFDEQTLSFLRNIDSKPIKDLCRKTLISCVITGIEPLGDRIEFVFKHLFNENDDKNVLKPTNGVLTTQERTLLEKILKNMRYFYVFLSKTDVDEYITGIILNGNTVFQSKPSLLEAQKSLIVFTITAITRQMEYSMTKVSDTDVFNFMRSSYGTTDDHQSLEVLKQKALNHARTLLEKRNTENNEAMWILHKTLNYISYCEKISQSQVKSTILWRDKQFSAVASEELLATMEAATIAVRELFDIPLQFYIFRDKEEQRQGLEKKINHLTGTNCVTSRICIDDQWFKADASQYKDSDNAVFDKVLDHIYRKNVKKIVDWNRRMIASVLIQKSDPLIDRIRFVIEYMRDKDSVDGFDATDNVLTKVERTRLLSIDKNIKIQEKLSTYEATVNINDNILSASSFKEIDARNEVIIAAYLYLESMSIAREKSEERATVVSQKSSDSNKSEPLEKKTSDESPKELFFSTYSKTDTALQFPSIVWYKVTLSKYPIETTESDTHIFTSSIIYEKKIFKEMSKDRDKSRHKVACQAMRQLWNVDSEFWKEFDAPDKVTPVDVLPKTLKSQSKQDTLELYKKRAQDVLKVRQKALHKLQPGDLWNSATAGKFPIQTNALTPVQKGYISEIQFFDQKFAITDVSKAESRLKVAIVAIKELFGISLPHWVSNTNSEKVNNLPNNKPKINTDTKKFEKAQLEAIKVYHNRAKEILNKSEISMQNVTPDELWKKVTQNKHVIQTVQTPEGAYLSTIQFFDQKFRRGGLQEFRTRANVAIVAFDNLLGINLPHWRIYLDSKTPQTSVPNLVTSCLDKEKEEYYAKRAKDVLLSISATKMQISPADLWNRITGGKFVIATKKHESGEHASEINFLGKTFAEKHSDELMSRHRVALIALSLLFGIHFEHWKKYLTVPSDDKEVNKRIETVKRYEIRLKEMQCPSNYDQKQWTPAKMWHGLTQQHFPIETKSFQSGFRSVIKFHDKSFTVENKDEMLSRHEVAKVAFQELFGVCLPQWKKDYNEKSVSNSQASSRASSVASLVDNLKKNENFWEKLKYYNKRANELVSRRKVNGNKVYPVDLWNSITESKFPIKTTNVDQKFLSHINFYDNAHSATDADENKSRHKVAVSALHHLFGVYFQYWSEYSTLKVDQGRSSVEKEKPDTIMFYQNRAKDILSRPKVKLSDVLPVDLWNGTTAQKYKISTRKGLSDDYTAEIKFNGQTFTAHDVDETKSRHKVAALVFDKVLDISPSHWNVFKDSNEMTNESKIKQIEMKIKELREQNIMTNPTDFWYRAICGHVPIVTQKKNEYNESTIDYFGVVFSASHTNYQTSRNMIAAIALNDLFKVNYSHWNDHNPFAAMETTSSNEHQENVADVTPLENETPCVETVKLSEEAEQILHELQLIADKINENHENPVDLWTQIVKDHPKYQIIIAFDNKSHKYEATIEFHEKVFIKKDFDQDKAETLVACAALEELMGVEFEEEDENSDVTKNEESKLVEEKLEESLDTPTEEQVVPEVSPVEAPVLLVSSNDEIDRESIHSITPRKQSTSHIFYEPLIKRVQTVLENVASHYLTSSYLIFKHSNTPVLTEDEWKILKEIYVNVFNVNMDQSTSDIMMSVVINGYQVFGGGITTKETKDATIIAAFEYFEKMGLEIGVDEIEISKRTFEDEEDDNSDQENICLKKLKHFQNSLQKQNTCLDDVPCSAIFNEIGINFKFEFDYGENRNDTALSKVKEMTSRFAIKKLLDLAYDLDD